MLTFQPQYSVVEHLQESRQLVIVQTSLLRPTLVVTKMHKESPLVLLDLLPSLLVAVKTMMALRTRVLAEHILLLSQT